MTCAPSRPRSLPLTMPIGERPVAVYPPSRRAQRSIYRLDGADRAQQLHIIMSEVLPGVLTTPDLHGVSEDLTAGRIGTTDLLRFLSAAADTWAPEPCPPPPSAPWRSWWTRFGARRSR